MRKSIVGLALSVGLIGTSILMAQAPDRATNRGDAPSGMRSAMSMLQRQFDQRAPAIGSELPDLSVSDGDGNPLKVRDLRGKFTVIVFGCLT